MKALLRMFVAFMALMAGSALAIDDRFNPHSYENGGFSAVSDATYTKECGGCHFAYLPGMLPERSWVKLLSLGDHFGETLSLEPAVLQDVQRYLVANAADHSRQRGSEAILYRLRDDVTPVRITQLPVMYQRHYIVQNMLVRNPKAAVKKLTNCNDCHEKAMTGSFAYEEIVVPGISKVVRPGAMF